MKTKTCTLITCLAIAMAACNYEPMSSIKKDETAGYNGGFEITQNGLPVNWNIYTNQTVPESDFWVGTDTLQFIAGRQSMKFDVKKCNQTGGWKSPGFAGQFPATEGEVYTITFWVKMSESKIRIKIGSVNEHQAKYDVVSMPSEKSADWQLVKHTCTIQKKMNALRFEFNALTPGKVWIDEIKIEKAN